MRSVQTVVRNVRSWDTTRIVDGQVYVRRKKHSGMIVLTVFNQKNYMVYSHLIINNVSFVCFITCRNVLVKVPY